MALPKLEAGLLGIDLSRGFSRQRNTEWYP